MAEERETFVQIRPRLLKAHLAIHVIVSGAAVGSLINALRSALPYPAAVSLLFWLFAILLYPAAAIFAETHGNQWLGARPFLRWFIQFTGAAAVMFVVTLYLGPR